MQMKKYGGKTAENERPDNPQVESQQEPAVKEPEESYDTLVNRIDNRGLVIPGYGKSSALQKKLNVIEAPRPKT